MSGERCHLNVWKALVLELKATKDWFFIKVKAKNIISIQKVWFLHISSLTIFKFPWYISQLISWYPVAYTQRHPIMADHYCPHMNFAVFILNFFIKYLKYPSLLFSLFAPFIYFVSYFFINIVAVNFLLVVLVGKIWFLLFIFASLLFRPYSIKIIAVYFHFTFHISHIIYTFICISGMNIYCIRVCVCQIQPPNNGCGYFVCVYFGFKPWLIQLLKIQLNTRWQSIQFKTDNLYKEMRRVFLYCI